MAIGSCSSCSSSNPATQYAQELQSKLSQSAQETSKNVAQDLAKEAVSSVTDNRVTAPGNAAQSSGSTVNAQGEVLGTLVSTAA